MRPARRQKTWPGLWNILQLLTAAGFIARTDEAPVSFEISLMGGVVRSLSAKFRRPNAIGSGLRLDSSLNSVPISKLECIERVHVAAVCSFSSSSIVHCWSRNHDPRMWPVGNSLRRKLPICNSRFFILSPHEEDRARRSTRVALPCLSANSLQF
ncbi:hypothetical protein GGR53DRAFT_483919 [Hypoxylon sp. FL1150]|nr:hypothetical protein GGR53DRAFT_483919 [Hypoxylon sp. FL1150]